MSCLLSQMRECDCKNLFSAANFDQWSEECCFSRVDGHQKWMVIDYESLLIASIDLCVAAQYQSVWAMLWVLKKLLDVYRLLFLEQRFLEPPARFYSPYLVFPYKIWYLVPYCFFGITTVKVPSKLRQYQKVTWKHCRLLIGQKELRNTQFLHLAQTHHFQKAKQH